MAGLTDEQKRELARLFLQNMLEDLESRFLRAVERNVTSKTERLMMPMRDPVLDAEIVYEDILDAEVLFITEDSPANRWNQVRFIRKWKPIEPPIV